MSPAETLGPGPPWTWQGGDPHAHQDRPPTTESSSAPPSASRPRAGFSWVRSPLLAGLAAFGKAERVVDGGDQGPCESAKGDGPPKPDGKRLWGSDRSLGEDRDIHVRAA